MLDLVLDRIRNLRDSFLNLPPSRRILYAGSGIIILASLCYAFYLVNKPEYALLYSGLETEELARVTQALRSSKVPYRLGPNNSVLVPRDRIYEVRLSLASQNLPNGTTGFEIFDKQSLGSTRFIQRINYQRALQGELARTIDQLDEVMASRVHLVIPEESPFVEEQKPARAAVVLKLRPGARLSHRQIQGIVHLVASAVQGLDEQHVTVLSTDGTVLFGRGEGELNTDLSTERLAYKNRLEEELRTKVQSMLERVLGPDQVVTRVVTDLDFSKAQIMEEKYDPDSSVIRSQQKSIEVSQREDNRPRGNPDAPINLEGQLMRDTPPGSEKRKEFQRQRETINYEVSKVNRRMIQVPGRIKRLSVAVIVDGRYEIKKGADNTTERVFVGRSPKELKAIEDLVKKAVGFNEERGDQISISNIPFASSASGLAHLETRPGWLEVLKGYHKSFLNLALVFLMFLLVVRPLLKALTQVDEDRGEVGKDTEALQEVKPEEGGGFPALEEGTQPLSLKEQAAALMQQDAERAAEIIRGWLIEEGESDG